MNKKSIVDESKLGRQHTGALQADVIWGYKGYFRDLAFDPKCIERDSRKRKFIDGIRNLTAPREVTWDSPKSWHVMRYWERKRHSGNSGMAEVWDAGLLWRKGGGMWDQTPLPPPHYRPCYLWAYWNPPSPWYKWCAQWLVDHPTGEASPILLNPYGRFFYVPFDWLDQRFVITAPLTRSSELRQDHVKLR